MNYLMRSLLERSKRILLGALTFLFIAISFEAKAQEYCGMKPVDFDLVYDEAGIISDAEESRLNRKLNAFKDSTSNVILVVTHPTLCGEEAWKFATDLGHTWGVGTEKDNGVVIAVKPPNGGARGDMHIAVGQGLEGAITDAMAKRIVEQEFIPMFKQDRYFAGINNGSDVLMAIAAGEITEYLGTSQKKELDSKKLRRVLFPLLIVLLILGAGIIRTGIKT